MGTSGAAAPPAAPVDAAPEAAAPADAASDAPSSIPISPADLIVDIGKTVAATCNKHRPAVIATVVLSATCLFMVLFLTAVFGAVLITRHGVDTQWSAHAACIDSGSTHCNMHLDTGKMLLCLLGPRYVPSSRLPATSHDWRVAPPLLAAERLAKCEPYLRAQTARTLVASNVFSSAALRHVAYARMLADCPAFETARERVSDLVVHEHKTVPAQGIDVPPLAVVEAIGCAGAASHSPWLAEALNFALRDAWHVEPRADTLPTLVFTLA